MLKNSTYITSCFYAYLLYNVQTCEAFCGEFYTKKSAWNLKIGRAHEKSVGYRVPSLGKYLFAKKYGWYPSIEIPYKNVFLWYVCVTS